MADPVETRLRAARPEAADVDPDAFDAALLEQVKRRAPRRRRAGRLALPAAVGIAAAAVAVVLASSGTTTTPTADAAVRQAQEWFSPPAGTILHYRSEMTGPPGSGEPLIQEIWQAVDDPSRRRYLQSQNGLTSEFVDQDLYDPSTNTIFVSEQRTTGETQLGDPMVVEIRRLLRTGKATLGEEAVHAGVPAYPITLRPGRAGDRGPRWTLWTAADDGRPLELVIDSGPDTRVEQTTRWTTYEVIPLDPEVLTLRGAHPDARIVRDQDAYDAANARLHPNG